MPRLERGIIVKVEYGKTPPDLYVWIRGVNGLKYKITIKGFNPYFFIKINERAKDLGALKRSTIAVEEGYQGLFGEKLRKIVVRKPSDVAYLRKQFDMHYEADIPFTRRFLIDKGLRNGVLFNPQKPIVRENELLPAENVTVEPIKMYLDIEVKSGDRFPTTPDYPVVLATFYVNGEYTTFVLGSKRKTIEKRLKDGSKHILFFVESELELFRFIQKYIDLHKPDILTGWNVFFDVDYLRDRANKLGVRFDLSGVNVFDLLTAYAKIADRFSNRLKDVVVEEGLAKEDELVADEWRSEFFDKDLDKAIEYNRDDVKYLVEIDKKYSLLDFFWFIKSEIGLENMSKSLANSVLVDTLVLRTAYSNDKTKRRVLPSGGLFENEGKFKGAVVFKPREGVYENVAIFDMSRYYPSIILTFGLSPEGKNGILTEVVKVLMHYRDIYDKAVEDALEKYGVDSVEYRVAYNRKMVAKYILNSVYGYTGFTKSRLYKRTIAETITRKAREGILFLGKVSSKILGRPVIYGDTDSIMINVKGLEEVKKIEKLLNKALAKWCEKQGVEPLLKIKFERFAKRIIFVRKKGDTASIGAKKRYAAWITHEGDKEVDYVLVKGFEMIRRDTAKITKDIQSKIFELGLRGKIEELRDYIVELVRKVYNGGVDFDYLAQRVTLGQDIEKYKSETEVVRACKYTTKHYGIKFYKGDIVKILYVKAIEGKPRTDVVAYLDPAMLRDEKMVLNIDKIVEKFVVGKTERLLSLFGLNIREIVASVIGKNMTLGGALQ